VPQDRFGSGKLKAKALTINLGLFPPSLEAKRKEELSRKVWPMCSLAFLQRMPCRSLCLLGEPGETQSFCRRSTVLDGAKGKEDLIDEEMVD
jgi:hypothetical protein